MTEVRVDEVKPSSYIPGTIGRITELHATYYYHHWGLDLNFESQMATELSAFFLRFDKANNGFWVAIVDDKIVGSVAIDGRDSAEGARLRWFILVSEYQGQGIGKTLLQKAIKFCHHAKFKQVYLETFAGLETARYLYEKFGFILCKESQDSTWGRTITRQMFKLSL